MTKLYVCFISFFCFMMTACSESSTMEEPEDTTPDAEQLVEYITGISEEIDPLFMECETIEELATYLDKIKKIKGVADAWVTNTALYIETKGGFPLSWLYTPDVDTEEMEEMLATISQNELISSRSTTWNEHVYMENSDTVCLINQTVNDENFAVVKGCLDDIEIKFENAGFYVDLKYGKQADLDFFTSELTANDIILIITHGGFDGKRHWLLTGEPVSTSTEKDRIISLIGTYGVSEQKLRGKYGFGFCNMKEKRGGEPKEVRYIMLSEKCIEENTPKSEKGYILFCGACQSLKGNNDLANVFIKKGAKLYLGYDENNGVAHKAGKEFYDLMLKGKMAKDAFEEMSAGNKINENKKKKIIARLKSIGDKNICIVHPSVFTLDATNIGNSSVILNGEIKGWRNLEGDVGFCYSKDYESLDVENGYNHTEVNLTNENNMCDVKVESIELENLEPETTYYFRTYIYINGQYIYGDVKTFTTTVGESASIAEAVDLGLSVKWASHNVGATKPEEYGGYYAWGETEEKEGYFEYNYEHRDFVTGKYTDIGYNISASIYDVAHVDWKNGWRIPTSSEFVELIKECQWEDVECTGVKGRKVTGKNGNSIFLPFNGAKSGLSESHKSGNSGCYWASTQYSYSAGSMYTPIVLNITATGRLKPSGTSVLGAYLGLAVRPVKD